jgi:hypothetical protein
MLSVRFLGGSVIIEFSVSYTLEEYRSIVGDYCIHVLQEKDREKHLKKAVNARYPLRPLRFLIRTVASIFFYFKKREMPLCEFMITESDISRKTKQGTLTVSWSELTEIYQSSEGLILIDEDGGLPIPFRCISSTERDWIVERYERARSIEI